MQHSPAISEDHVSTRGVSCANQLRGSRNITAYGESGYFGQWATWILLTLGWSIDIPSSFDDFTADLIPF
jgi:hypothetical protein